MSSYLSKYVSQYRIVAEIDQNTNDFCRDMRGNLCNDDDVYIKCKKGIKIFHFGRGVLQVYIPSLKRGNNILKAIEEDGNKELVTNIERTDSEVLFKIKDKHLSNIIQHLNPVVTGANISPFSTKNLPKKRSILTEEELEEYKKIVEPIIKTNPLIIRTTNTEFSKKIGKRLKMNEGQIIADAKKEMVSLRDYFYLKGFKEEYLNQLRKKVHKEIEYRKEVEERNKEVNKGIQQSISNS